MIRIPSIVPILCCVITSLAGAETDQWFAKANAYLAQDAMPQQWEIRSGSKAASADLLQLKAVLQALPDPESWADLRKSLHALEGSDAQRALMGLLLTYLDGDVDAIASHLSELDDAFAAGATHPEREYPLQVLKDRFLTVQTMDSPDDLIEAFEIRLKQYLPIDQAEVAGVVGGQEVLDSIDALLDAQKVITDAYQKVMMEGKGAAESSAALQELQAQASQMLQDHAEAVNALQAHITNPLVMGYLKERAGMRGVHSYAETIAVPDLVTFEGEQGAAKRLLRALQAPVVLQINNADATLALAQKLALKHADQLKAPQWQLANSLGQVALYEAMAARFSSTSQYDYSRTRATGFYFWGLVAEGRSDDAIQLIRENPEMWDNLPYHAMPALREAGYAPRVWEFLDQLLGQHPEVDLWHYYIELSAEVDQSEAMLTAVHRIVETADTDPATSSRMLSILADAYLSAGQLDLGIARLLQMIERDAVDSEDAEKKFHAALQLATIGRLVDNQEWLNSGMMAAENYFASLDLIGEYGRVNVHLPIKLADIYLNAGQDDSAESLLLKTLQKLQQPIPDHPDRAFRQSRDASEYQRILTALCRSYLAAGRYAEIIELLQSDVRWHAKDLAAIVATRDSSLSTDKLGWIVAKALHETGDSAAAVRILEALLREKNGYDPAYALYLEIQGDAAINFLEKLSKIDRFEERPLIWMAQHLVSQGQLEAAEAMAARAIEIDPSDGEQPKGDRMRVYGVMQQIREAQGDAEGAAFFADVLKAIRLAEAADELHTAGLHSEAIELYRESLGFFQDAYCIQSRLAVSLYNEGRVDEAKAHYQKAYELMPSSFGRVESHCFGCESIFKGDQPQSIAEEVFAGLLEAQPEVPQVHYLFGYLRNYQGNHVEALAHFQEAVRLDPYYLNAWKEILSLSRQMAMDTATKDELILTIYALDPLGRHSWLQLNEVSDIKAMWRMVLGQQAMLELVPKQDAVFSLTAAAQNHADNDGAGSFDWNAPVAHPADALARNDVVEAVENLFIALSR
jgi:tetratricopeptide (TPR) repeat protein